MTVVPVGLRPHAVDQSPVVQHRHVEAAAVPGHQRGPVLLHAVEELLDQLGLLRRLVADRPAVQGVAGAQHTGDRDDALQVRRLELGALLRAAQGAHRVPDDLFVHGLDAQDAARALEVGDGFDVEDEGRAHRET